MSQAYFNGEFYQCATTTVAGESPTTAPAKWRRIQIPAQWRWILTHLTYAHLLELDGQKDKANAERAVALETERVGLEDTIRREANAELRRLGRPAVQTPYNTNMNGVTGLRPFPLVPNSFPPP